MNRWRPSLFLKLSGTSIALILTTSISIAVFVTYRQIEQIEQQLVRETKVLAEMVALNSEFGIYTESVESLSGVLQGVFVNPDLSYVAVLDKDQRTLLARGSMPVLPPDPAGRFVATGDGRVFDWSTPVYSGTLLAQDEQPAPAGGKQVIGYVRIALSDARLQRQIQSSLTYVFLVTSLLIAFGVLLSVMTTRLITRPIQQLAEAFKKIAAGRLDEPIVVTSRDEIADLAAAFDVMRKSLEERTNQLEQVAESANAANAAKTIFLAKMSHELRTPLNAVIGFTEVLIDQHFGAVNETQTEYLGDILSSGRHLLSLVEDVLDLSRVEAGETEPHALELEIAELFQSAIRTVREPAEKAGVQLTSSTDPSVGELIADPRMMKQVLLNLLANAVKFTRRGGTVHLESSAVDLAWLREHVRSPFETELAMASASGATRFVRIAVRDSGIGIHPDSFRRVFEAFQQEDNSIGRQYGGSGLGLALCKKMVELHGGVIWVESERDVGSVFTLAIPVAPDEVPAETVSLGTSADPDGSGAASAAPESEPYPSTARPR